jgi:hypothetical protein
MCIGFCVGVINYVPYYGSAGFRAVADNFSCRHCGQGGSWYSFAHPSIGSGFSFYPGGVFGGSCWSVPGDTIAHGTALWFGLLHGRFSAAYLPNFQYLFFSDLYP